MRRLNSAEFKREWRYLGEPVIVTVGKKAVGIYTPTNRHIVDVELPAAGEISRNQVPARSVGSLPPWRSSVPFPEEPRWE